MTAAFVNWNPDPEVHAYGTTMTGGRVLALCRVTVRKRAGDFDPDGERACRDCAEFVQAGLSWDDIKDRKIEIPPNAIVCSEPRAAS